MIGLAFGQQSSKLEVSAFCPVPFGENNINNAFNGYTGISGVWLLENEHLIQYETQVNMAYLHRKEFETPLYMFAAVPVVSYKYEVSD
ncbi:MAG: hypothetical protein JEZ03_14690 [Bacteroidales bacterium]|nr:hypothetical protein [Bacteroidales bacterium]